MFVPIQGDLILKSDYVIETVTKIVIAAGIENLVDVCDVS